MADIDVKDLDYKIDRLDESLDKKLKKAISLLRRHMQDEMDEIIAERDEKIERLEARLGNLLLESRVENLENVVYSHKGGKFLEEKS